VDGRLAAEVIDNRAVNAAHAVEEATRDAIRLAHAADEAKGLERLQELEPLTKIGMEPTPADHRLCQFHERLVQVVALVVAHPQPAVLVHPAQRPLHRPAHRPEAAAVGLAAPSEHRDATADLHRLAVGLGVVGAVAHHQHEPAPGRARTPGTAGAGASSGSSWVTSWRLAPVSVAASGVPLVSVSR